MEVLIGAGSGLMGMFSGGGAAAAGASAAGLGGAASGFSAMSSLASMGGGVMKLFTGFASAEGTRAQGALERVSSEMEIAQIGAERNRIIANNLVVAAANGLDVSAGEPADQAIIAEKDAEAAINRERMNQAMRRYAINRTARAQEISGISGLVEGFASGAREMASSSIKTSRRGV
jgi:hypothetical protein